MKGETLGEFSLLFSEIFLLVNKILFLSHFNSWFLAKAAGPQFACKGSGSFPVKATRGTVVFQQSEKT